MFKTTGKNNEETRYHHLPIFNFHLSPTRLFQHAVIYHAKNVQLR